MELEGYDDAQINTPDMVTNACQLNQVIALVHVLIQRCLIEQVVNLMLKIGSQANSTDKALHTPQCPIIYGLRWVSLAEYILVVRVYSLFYR